MAARSATSCGPMIVVSSISDPHIAHTSLRVAAAPRREKSTNNGVQGAGTTKVVEFVLFGQPFIAMSHERPESFNHAISLMVNCGDQAELDRYWHALLEGGGSADGCGWLRDRFGVSWQIVPDARSADHLRETIDIRANRSRS